MRNKFPIEEVVDISFEKRQVRAQLRYKRRMTAKRVQRCQLNKKISSCRLPASASFSKLGNSIEKALEDARSTRPRFIMRESKISGANKGVFVSSEYTSAPMGTIIPYCGNVKTCLSYHYRNAQYQVDLGNGKMIVSSNGYIPGQPLANFVNRVMSPSTWKEYVEQNSALLTERLQNLLKTNATLTCFRGVCYIRLIRDVPCGDEILIAYGRAFRIV